jgi:nucleotide-binding universal stress UspA family protein
MLVMYKHILISTDGSEVAQRELITASRWPRASVRRSWWSPGKRQAASKLLASVHDAAEKLGVDAAVLHVPDARPAEATVDLAGARGFSLIVMASHGRRGFRRMLLGSQTAEVLAHSPMPVLVVR